MPEETFESYPVGSGIESSNWTPAPADVGAVGSDVADVPQIGEDPTGIFLGSGTTMLAQGELRVSPRSIPRITLNLELPATDDFVRVIVPYRATGSAFRFFHSFGFTGVPESIPHLPEVVTAGNDPAPYTGSAETSLAVDIAAVGTVLAGVADGGHLVWDIEDLTSRLDTRVYSGELADRVLDFLGVLTTATHFVAAALGKTVSVGYYAPPIDFNAIRNHLASPSDPTYLASYEAYVETLRRQNRRADGRTISYSLLMDFIIVDIYPYNGNSAYAIAEWRDVQGRMLELAREHLSGDKPLYPYFQMHFVPSGAYAGKPVGAALMRAAVELCQAKADGIILWGGWGSSYVTTNKPFVTSTSVAATWAAITDGAFHVVVSGSDFLVTGLSFAGAASMSDVANVLQNAINDAIAAAGAPVGDVYPAAGLPYHVGDVTVTWDGAGSKFVIDNPAGSAKVPAGTTLPPDSGFFRYDTYFYYSDDWTGTNLVKPQWIGTAGFGAVSPRDADEWANGWAEGMDWWETFIDLATVGNRDAAQYLAIEARRIADGTCQLSAYLSDPLEGVDQLLTAFELTGRAATAACRLTVEVGPKFARAWWDAEGVVFTRRDPDIGAYVPDVESGTWGIMVDGAKVRSIAVVPVEEFPLERYRLSGDSGDDIDDDLADWQDTSSAAFLTYTVLTHSKRRRGQVGLAQYGVGGDGTIADEYHHRLDPSQTVILAPALEDVSIYAVSLAEGISGPRSTAAEFRVETDPTGTDAGIGSGRTTLQAGGEIFLNPGIVLNATKIDYEQQDEASDTGGREAFDQVASRQRRTFDVRARASVHILRQMERVIAACGGARPAWMTPPLTYIPVPVIVPDLNHETEKPKRAEVSFTATEL